MDKPDSMFNPLSNEEAMVEKRYNSSKNIAEWVPIHPVPGDAPEPTFKHNSLGDPSRTWEYRVEDGALNGHVARFDIETDDGPKKEFRPRTYCRNAAGECRWMWKGFAKPWPLYGLDKLAGHPDAPVIVNEGEKAAAGAQERFPEYVSVSPMHGAESPHLADFLPLDGRDVIVVGDHDVAGKKFAAEVARLCQKAGATDVSIVDWPDDFPDQFDFADDPPEGWDDERLFSLIHSAQPAPPLNDEAEIDRLADLDPIDYDRERKKVADRMGIRMSTLDEMVEDHRKQYDSVHPNTGGENALFDDLEPWPHEVDGAELLQEIVAALESYVVLPEGASLALALWILHAHAHDAALVSSILTIVSPDRRCGKTTTMSVIQFLVPRAIPTSNITTAAVFRAVEKWQPTLLIDEADTGLP